PDPSAPEHLGYSHKFIVLHTRVRAADFPLLFAGFGAPCQESWIRTVGTGTFAIDRTRRSRTVVTAAPQRHRRAKTRSMCAGGGHICQDLARFRAKYRWMWV
ncbi:MAG: hypothetical protein M0005_11195, partial [Actinomycetota bacterium]|nr:hypothetical protein [Actinomycetota bacterium]